MISVVKCGRCEKLYQQVSEKTVTLPQAAVTIGGVAFLLRGISVSLARVDGKACQGEPPFICVACCEVALMQRLHDEEHV